MIDTEYNLDLFKLELALLTGSPWVRIVYSILITKKNVVYRDSIFLCFWLGSKQGHTQFLFYLKKNLNHNKLNNPPKVEMFEKVKCYHAANFSDAEEDLLVC